MTDLTIKMIKLQEDAETDNSEDQAQDRNDKDLQVDLDIKFWKYTPGVQNNVVPA